MSDDLQLLHSEPEERASALGGRRPGSQETALGSTIEWYTPPELFERLGLEFDLDPASPMDGPLPWVPAKRFYSARENGLVQPWEGRVWLNPPYGPAMRPFLDKMDHHRDGLVLVFARTETRWLQHYAPRADLVCFLRDRLSFVAEDRRWNRRGQAGSGSILLAYGTASVAAVERADLGWTIRPEARP